MRATIRDVPSLRPSLVESSATTFIEKPMFIIYYIL